MDTRPDYITQAEDAETGLTVDTTDRNPFVTTLQDWFRPGPHARTLHGDNRIVAEQRAALVAEVRRLNALNRDLHRQAVDAEERAKKAALRLEEYANEREAVHAQFDRIGIPVGLLAQRLRMLAAERDELKRQLTHAQRWLKESTQDTDKPESAA